jgi:hypothetical protein
MTPVGAGRGLTPTVFEENPFFSKIYSNPKKYSILSVPSSQQTPDPISKKDCKSPDLIYKTLDLPSEPLFKFPPNKKEKVSLAKIKKIKRSYRPQSGRNDENLKQELRKIEESQAQRTVLIENFKITEKSDIELLLESQKTWKKMKSLKKKPEILKSHDLNQPDQNEVKVEKINLACKEENFADGNADVAKVLSKTPKSRMAWYKKNGNRTGWTGEEKGDYKQESWKVLKNTAFLADKIMKGIRMNAKIKFICL